MSNNRNRRRALPLSKKLCFSVISVTVLLGILELVARIVVSPPDVLVHQEHESLITVGGLPALNETMEYDPYLFWRLKAGLNDFPVSGSNGQYRIDFRVTTNQQHLRCEPIAVDKDRSRILVLGDSCAFGIGVADNETWPAQLQESLLAAGHNVRVINGGVPGYTAFQGLRFLRKHAASLQPDLVICCFGFNDQDTWASQSDFETARSLDLAAWQAELTQHSRLYQGLRQTFSRLPSREQREVPRPRLLPVEYVSVLSGIKTLCDERNANLILLVWPFAAQVAARNPYLGPYQTLLIGFGQGHEVPVVNLAPEFVAEPEHLYVDHIHANAAGCRVTASALTAVIVPLLDGSSQ